MHNPNFLDIRLLITFPQKKIINHMFIPSKNKVKKKDRNVIIELSEY